MKILGHGAVVAKGFWVLCFIIPACEIETAYLF
jgi:hypothetical protein